MNKHRIALLVLLVLSAVVLRFMPQPPNFTPILALALFSGVFLRNHFLSVAAPLGVMLITDLFLGWHSTILFVYGAFVLMVAAGWMLRKRVSVMNIAGAGISGSLLFFLITNFGVWMTGTLYPKTWEGLAAAYVAAIPFFHNMIIGTLLYSAFFFGVFLLAERLYPSIREVEGAAGA